MENPYTQSQKLIEYGYGDKNTSEKHVIPKKYKR